MYIAYVCNVLGGLSRPSLRSGLGLKFALTHSSVVLVPRTRSLWANISRPRTSDSRDETEGGRPFRYKSIRESEGRGRLILAHSDRVRGTRTTELWANISRPRTSDSRWRQKGGDRFATNQSESPRDEDD